MPNQKAVIRFFYVTVCLAPWSCLAGSSSSASNSVVSVGLPCVIVLVILAVLLTVLVMIAIFKHFIKRYTGRLAAAFSVTPLHMAVIDRDGKFLYRQFSQDYLNSVTEVPKAFNELPEEVVRKFKEPIEEVFRTGEPYNIEYAFQGRMRQVELRKVPAGIFGREAVIGLSTDIEELSRSREGLVQTKEWLKLTLESIGDAVIVTDGEGFITLVNDVTARLAGYSREEMIGKQASEVLKLVNYLNDEPVPSPILKAISTGEIIELSNHTDLITPDGRRLHIADSAAPIVDADGHVSGAVMVFRDVTGEYEKRDSMHLQNRLLQAAAVVGEITYFCCDIHGNLVDDRVNRRLKDVIGDNKVYEGDWIFADDKKEYREQWRKLLSGEADSIDFSYRTYDSGELLYFELKVEKNTTPASGVDGYFGVFKNITRLKKSEQDYIHTNQLLQNIIENYPCPLFVKDIDDDFRYIVSNRAHAELCKICTGSEKTIIGNTDFEIHSREAAECFRGHDLQAANEPEQVFDIIERLGPKGGEVNSLRLLRKVLYREDGRKLILGIGVDVTRQEEAERELAQANRLLQTIMDNLPCALFVKDPDAEYRYIMSNQAFAGFMGQKVEEMPGKTDFDIFIRPEDAAGCRASDTAAVASGELFDGREVVMGASREIHTLHCIKTIVDYGDGRRLLLGICIDITGQEIMERKLAGTNRMFQTIMDNLPCALFVKNPGDDYRYIMGNRTFAAFIGRGVDEIPGKEDRELFFREEDVAGCHVSDAQAVESGQVVDGQEVIMDAAGNVHTLHCIKTTFEYEDGQRLLVGICLDVTSQQFAERELARTSRLLQTIMDNLPCAVFVKDPDNDYKYIMANSTFAAFMGYTVDDMPGKTDYDLFIRSTDADGCRRSDADAVKSGTVLDCKEVVMGGDRNIYVLRCVKSTVDYDDGQRLLMGICLDITAQEEAERKLVSALAAAESANKAKSFFLATVSHELRTPLNVVIGFSELLKRGGMSPDEQLDYIQSINFAGNALLNLINDVLDLSKIEADQMEITPQPVDMAGILDEIMAIFSYKAKEKKIDFQMVRPPELPIMELDSLRLRQILLNVVGNALKFTHAGYVRLQIEFKPESAAGVGTLIIRVIDTGVGISPEYKAKIFEPFVQQRSTRGANEGTGLGLTITSRLINKMGGRIELESELGKGSVFIITLAGIRYDYPTVATTAVEAVPLSMTEQAGSLDILIVDDVPVNLKVLKAMLKQLDLDCRMAGSGLEALAEIDKKVPDLILTDMWMPNMNGHDLALKIRDDSRCKNVRIIAITADSETKATFNMDCFDDVFLKPLTLEKLRKLFGDGQKG